MVFDEVQDLSMLVSCSRQRQNTEFSKQIFPFSCVFNFFGDKIVLNVYVFERHHILKELKDIRILMRLFSKVFLIKKNANILVFRSVASEELSVLYN
jgi:hypothetical protein